MTNVDKIIMDMSDDELRKFVINLNGKSKQIITDALMNNVAGSSYKNINEYFSHINKDRIRECPNCHSVTNIIKNGPKTIIDYEEGRNHALKNHNPLDKVDVNYLVSNNLPINKIKVPRYLCKNCGKSFMDSTGTIAQYTRLPVKAIHEYAVCYVEGYVLEDCADKIGMSVQSAHLWRHKFSEALRLLMPDLILSRKIEVDIATFEIKQNGNYNHPVVTPAVVIDNDSEYVSVAMLADNKGCIVPMVSNEGPKINNDRLLQVSKDNIRENAYVLGSDNCIDSVNAVATAINCKSIPDDIRERFEEVYNACRAEGYTKDFNQFVMDHFGISPKYLNNYTAWHCLTQDKKGRFYGDADSLMDYALSANVVVTRRTLSTRPRLSLDKVSDNAL